MPTPPPYSACWSTSSFEEAKHDESPELILLRQHLCRCQRNSSRLFFIQCHLESMKGFASSRVVTTLIGFALLVGVGSAMLW